MSTPEAGRDRSAGGQQTLSRSTGGQPVEASFSGNLPSRHTNGSTDERLANALGWLSLGLGLAGLAAPREVARMIGVRDDERNCEVLRTVGVREIISGIGILAQPRPTPWLWTRVAGDLMDLALLGKALSSEPVEKNRLAAATAMVAGVTAADLYCSQQLSRGAQDGLEATENSTALRVQAITVRQPVDEVYRFWHNFENLPRFMVNLESVQMINDRISRWRAKGPAGTTVEWDAETIEDLPNEVIAWQSLPGSDIQHTGRVRFCEAPAGRGTEVKVEMVFRPPAGVVGEKIAFLFGKDPKQMLREDMRRFKQVMETGEVVLSEGALFGNTFPQRAAKPPTEQDLTKAQLPKAA